MVGRSRKGDIVYDPFMGRHYIGSEISDKYVQMANEKIKIEQSQLKLF